jgi:hypothetical protein
MLQEDCTWALSGVESGIGEDWLACS